VDIVSKIVIIVLLVAMIASLGVGLYHLLKSPDENDKGDKVVKALTWRIGIWAVLFVFILAAVKLGWIEPSNSVHPAKFNQEQQERIDQQEND
jgi:ABC-type dipeptide/oligopeptide/nickel transport system permease component